MRTKLCAGIDAVEHDQPGGIDGTVAPTAMIYMRRRLKWWCANSAAAYRCCSGRWALVTAAQRLIDFMAEDGIVGGYNGSNAREVTYTPEAWAAFRGSGGMEKHAG